MSGSNDKDLPSQDELDQMSKEELVTLGTNLDGVEASTGPTGIPSPAPAWRSGPSVRWRSG